MSKTYLDLAALLQPFPGDQPAGQDPRSDISPQSLYFRLRDARAEARQAERMAEHDLLEAGVPAAWSRVRQYATTILGDIGKDIEVATWLTEALVREGGLIGLMESTLLLTGLVNDFWNSGLFPLPDEDGIEGRTVSLAGLNGTGGDGTLMQPLRQLVLFDRPDQTPVMIWRYQRAEEVEGLGDETQKQQRIAAGTWIFSELEAEARGYGAEKLAEAGRAARTALEAWKRLDAVLTAVAGQEAPPMGRIASAIEKIVRVAEYLVPERLADSEASASSPDEPMEGMAAVEAVRDASGRPVSQPRPTRESMLRTLSEVADFFRKHEPQSPLAYTLDEAVRRGRMAWPELLAEIVQDEQVRAMIQSHLGIRPVYE